MELKLIWNGLSPPLPINFDIEIPPIIHYFEDPIPPIVTGGGGMQTMPHSPSRENPAGCSLDVSFL